MSNLDLEAFIENLLANWFGNHESQITSVALQDAAADAGYNPQDLNDLDWKQVYQNACAHPGVPADYRYAAQNYEGPATVEHVVRQIQQVTEVHNFNQQIFDNSTNIDNSVDVDIDGDVDGDLDLDIDNHPVTADDGGVAAGGDVSGAATGDNANATGSGDINDASGGSTIVDGDNFGNANSGDNAAQVDQSTNLVAEFPGGPVRGPIGEVPFGTGAEGLTRSLTEVPVQPHTSPITINTGSGSQEVANVTGQGNLTNFGDGDPTNLAGATVDHSAVGHDHVGNFVDNTTDHGSNLGMESEQQASYDDHTQHTEVDNSGASYSPVQVEQGDGDLQDDHHVDAPLPS